jgi:hypothetical protein
VRTEDVLLAVLSELHNIGVTPSKTKLLKLLYLVDLETMRGAGRTATGWDWVFLHFGPWAPAYDAELERLTNRDFLALKGIGADERATIVISQHRERDAASLDDVVVQNAIGRVITRWGSADLPDILNFVYFDTEPMHEAERHERLDFSKVPRGRYPVYRRTASDADQNTLRKMRERINRSAPAMVREEPFKYGYTPPRYTPPKYDEDVVRALATIEED